MIEDWEFFFELAMRMGLVLNVGSRVWEPGASRPTTDELLESLAHRAQVPYEEVRAAPHGALFDVPPIVVDAPDPNAGARFDLLPSDVEVTHINLNDKCVEGMRHKTLPVISVQYHPEAAPGPHDAAHHFRRFIELMERKSVAA